MLIAYIHLYVENAIKTRNWLEEKMGFQSINKVINQHTHTEIVTQNYSIFFLISSALNVMSPVYHYLNKFAEGVADVAFQVKNINAIIDQLSIKTNSILSYPHTYFFPTGKLKIAKIKGFNSLQHTLIENYTQIPVVDLLPQINHNLNNVDRNFNFINQSENLPEHQSKLSNYNLTGIDHIVLNVARDKLTEAVKFYQQVFNFKIWQKFNIKTQQSGLSSQALISPTHNFYFNINEPTSDNSQIQEFLDYNGGSGIQHIALRSNNIIEDVTNMRFHNLQFLPISANYYSQLKKDYQFKYFSSLNLQELLEIEKQQILVDYDQKIPDSLLMQIFTKPIFNQPTFFFEIIERRKQAQGFGQGNFQALFESVEKQQLERIKVDVT